MFPRPRLITAVDPAHIAFRYGTPQFAVAADRSGLAAVDLALGQAGSVSGSTIKIGHAASQQGLGPGLVNGLGLTDSINFSGRQTSVFAGETVAAVVTLNSASSVLYFFSSSSAANGIAYGVSTTDQWTIRVRSVGTLFSSGIPTPIGVPVFIAISRINGASIENYFLRRLDTGQSYFYSTTSAANALAPNGTYRLGNGCDLTASWDGSIHMCVFVAGWLPLPVMAAWGNDPWGVFIADDGSKLVKDNFNSAAGGSTFTQAVSASQGQSASLRRSTGAIRSITQGQSFTMQRGILVPRSVVQAQAASVTRQHPRTQVVTQGQAITRISQVGKKILPTQGQSASVIASLAFLRSLSVTQAQSVTKALQIGKTASVSQAQALTVKRAITALRTFTQGCAVSVTKAVSKAVALTQSQAASQTAQKARLQPVSVTQAQVAQALRQFGKAISLTQGQSISIKRAYSKVVSVLQPQSVRAIKAITKVPITFVQGQVASAVAAIVSLLQFPILAKPVETSFDFYPAAANDNMDFYPSVGLAADAFYPIVRAA